MSRLRISVLALGAAIVALTALATTASGASHSKSAVSGNLAFVGIWTGPEQKNFQLVLDGFKKKFPDVSVKYTSGGDNTPTMLSTAIAGGNPPDLAAVGQPGLVKQFSARKAIKPHRLRQADDGEELRGVLGHARHVLGEALRHGLQGRQQVDDLVLDAARSRTRASSRRRPGPSCSRRPRRCAPRARRRTRSRAPTAGR